MTVAEESTAWPACPARVTGTSASGSSGTWAGCTTSSVHLQGPDLSPHHHHQLTFSLLYAWNENFVLPIIHDEVVHGKGSLLGKMPGDTWQRFANLRAYLAFMWAHPGKQLLFMGCELGQEAEWSHERSIDWVAGRPEPPGAQTLVRDLNRVYRSRPALWEQDSVPEGSSPGSTPTTRTTTCSRSSAGAGNASRWSTCPTSRPWWARTTRSGCPALGRWVEVLNTDDAAYGGSDVPDMGVVVAEELGWAGQPASAQVTLPPLATVWLTPSEGLKDSRLAGVGYPMPLIQRHALGEEAGRRSGLRALDRSPDRTLRSRWDRRTNELLAAVEPRSPIRRWKTGIGEDGRRWACASLSPL